MGKIADEKSMPMYASEWI